MLSAQALAAHFRARRAMVSIGSNACVCGPADLAPYSPSNAALVCLTRSQALAYRSNLRVNCVNVGCMVTPVEHAVQTSWHAHRQNWLAEAEKKQPFGSLVKPHQVARQVALLPMQSLGRCSTRTRCRRISVCR